MDDEELEVFKAMKNQRDECNHTKRKIHKRKYRERKDNHNILGR